MQGHHHHDHDGACDHHHPHEHREKPHRHDHGASDERRTLIAFAVTALFMVVEAVGGWMAGSLALMADAAHMLTDALALLMAWGAFRLGRMQADPRRSYGYRRFEVLAALINGLTVIALGGWIVVEAILRLRSPAPVEGGLMLIVATAGLVLNLVVLRVLGHHGHDHGHGHGHSNINIRGASLHVLGDLLGSVAAVGGGIVIMTTGWTAIDPILSMLVAALVLASAIRLVVEAGHILLEGSPKGFDEDSLRGAVLAQVPGVTDIHHVHAWMLTSGAPLLTLHAAVANDVSEQTALPRIKAVLEGLGYGHSVVQIERDSCPDKLC